MILAGMTAMVALAGAQATTPANPKTKTFVTKAPKTAIVLLGNKATDISLNFYKRGTKEDAAWTMDANGVFVPQPKLSDYDITSKKEFGDLFIHLEFRCPVDENGNPRTSGNSGIGFMGRYEIQIMNSIGKALESHECASLYSQTAPLVNACKKAGEWQTYDITFRVPRFDADGKKTEEARAIVYQNGTLVQDSTEFKGPTGIQYGDFKGEATTGPIVLQGNHDPVSFRNIWLIPSKQK